MANLVLSKKLLLLAPFQMEKTAPYPPHLLPAKFPHKLRHHKPLLLNHPPSLDHQHPLKMRQARRHQPSKLHDAHDKLSTSELGHGPGYGF
jgi:hypothetical protein